MKTSGEIFRFLASGAINTAATYALYLALLRLVPYSIAYTIAYLCGIGLAYVFNARFVFRVRYSLRSFLLFPLIYLLQYLLGLGALTTAVRILAIPQELAAMASIAVTLPVTFVLSRILLRTPDVSASPKPGEAG